MVASLQVHPDPSNEAAVPHAGITGQSVERGRADGHVLLLPLVRALARQAAAEAWAQAMNLNTKES